MRVLHLDAGHTLRGGQRQALLLIESLAADSLLLAPAGSPALAEAQSAGIACRPLNWRTLRAESARCDIVHCHDARSHTLAALCSRAPFVVSRRVVFAVRRGWLHRWKYARAAHYLAISQAVAAELRLAGIAEERISVVYDATALPAAVSPRRGPVVALHSDDPGKGRTLLGRSGLELHFSRDLAADLPSASVFVYVTDSEGLGSAALFAMAHGVPVVASRVGGLPEIVLDGQTGLLVENDPGAVSAAVRRLLNDRPLADRLAAAGRAMVEDRFRVARMAEETLAVYQKVLR